MHGAGHILEVFYLILAAQVMAFLFKRLNQPVVIGEVLAGILVGPALLGLVHEGEILEFIAELGAIFLLFMVGLETRLKDILAVGKEALLVAVLGVAFPFVGGYLFGLQIGFATLPSLFLGTALVATSVGITARVLQELGVLSRPYARVILGAAVIDDVLGLIILAVVNGVAKTGQVETGAILQLILLSVAFVGLAVALSPLFARLPLEKLPMGSPVGFALALGIGMAALAASIGLAPIVGAFLGGMLLSEVREKYRLEEPVFAIESFLAPLFFAMVGVRLELAALVSPATLVAGTVVTVIAILGKVLGGFLGSLTQGVRSALTFVTNIARKTVSVGVPADMVRGDIFDWGPLMASAFLASVPVALLYYFVIDKFVSGFTTAGAIR